MTTNNKTLETITEDPIRSEYSTNIYYFIEKMVLLSYFSE